MNIGGRVLFGGRESVNFKDKSERENHPTEQEVEVDFYDSAYRELQNLTPQNGVDGSIGELLAVLGKKCQDKSFYSEKLDDGRHIIRLNIGGDDRVFLLKEKQTNDFQNIRNKLGKGDLTFDALREQYGDRLTEIHGQTVDLLLKDTDQGKRATIKGLFIEALLTSLTAEVEKFKRAEDGADGILIARNVGRQLEDLGRRVADLEKLSSSGEVSSFLERLSKFREDYQNSMEAVAARPLHGDLKLDEISAPAAIKTAGPMVLQRGKRDPLGRANSWLVNAQRAMASGEERIGKKSYQFSGQRCEHFPMATECVARYFNLECKWDDEKSLEELRVLIDGYVDSKEFEHLVDGRYEVKNAYDAVARQLDPKVILTYLPRVADGLELLYGKGKISRAKYIALATEIRIAAFNAAQKSGLIREGVGCPNCDEFQTFFGEGRVIRGISEMTAKHIRRVWKYVKDSDKKGEQLSVYNLKNCDVICEQFKNLFAERIDNTVYQEGLSGQLTSGGEVVEANVGMPAADAILQRAFVYLATAGCDRDPKLMGGANDATDIRYQHKLLADLEKDPPAQDGVVLFSALTKLHDNYEKILDCDPENPSSAFQDFLDELTSRDHEGNLRIDRDISREPEKVLTNLKNVLDKGIKHFLPAGVDDMTKVGAVTNLFHVAHIISQAYARRYPLSKQELEMAAREQTKDSIEGESPLVRSGNGNDRLFRDIQQMRRAVLDPFLNERRTDPDHSHQPTDECVQRFERLGVKGQAQLYLSQMELVEESAAFQHQTTCGSKGTGADYGRAPRYGYTQSGDLDRVGHGTTEKKFKDPIVDRDGKYVRLNEWETNDSLRLCREVREDFYNLYLSRAQAGALDFEKLPPSMRESLEDELRNNFLQCDAHDGQNGLFNTVCGVTPEEAVISAFGRKVACNAKGPAVTCWATELGSEGGEENTFDTSAGAVYMNARDRAVFPDTKFKEEGGYGHNSYSGAIYRQNQPLRLDTKELTDPDAKRLFGGENHNLIVNGPVTEFQHPTYRWIKIEQQGKGSPPIISIRTRRNAMEAIQPSGTEGSTFFRGDDSYTYIRSGNPQIDDLVKNYPRALADGQYDIWLKESEGEGQHNIYFCRKGTLAADFVAVYNDADQTYSLQDATDGSRVIEKKDLAKKVAGLQAFGGGADRVLCTLGGEEGENSGWVQSIRFPQRQYQGRPLHFSRDGDGHYELRNDPRYQLQTKQIVRSDGRTYSPVYGYDKALILSRKDNPNGIKILLSYDQLMRDLDPTYGPAQGSEKVIELNYHLRDTQRWNDSLYADGPEGYLAMAMVAWKNGQVSDAARILEKVKFGEREPSPEARAMLEFLSRGAASGPAADASQAEKERFAIGMKARILLAVASGDSPGNMEIQFQTYLSYFSGENRQVGVEFLLPLSRLDQFAGLTGKPKFTEDLKKIRAQEQERIQDLDKTSDSAQLEFLGELPQLIQGKLRDVWKAETDLRAVQPSDIKGEIKNLRDGALAARRELESLLNKDLLNPTNRAEDAAGCLTLISYDADGNGHVGKMHRFLERLNPRLTAGERQGLYGKVVDYAAAVAKLRFAEKMQAALDADGGNIDFKVHPELTVPTNLNDNTFTCEKNQFTVQSALLFANFMADINPRDEQVTTFAEAANRAGGGGMIIAPMGGGKTKVLIPISVHRNASEGRLTVVEVLDSQYAGVGPDLATALAETGLELIDVKKEMGITDAASLTNFTTNRDNLKALADRLEAASTDLKSAVLVTRDVLNRLLLAYENLLASKDLATNGEKWVQLAYLSKIFKIFKQARLTVDEAHKVFDPKESLIIASQSSSGTTAVENKYKALTGDLYRLLAGGGQAILNKLPEDIRTRLVGENGVVKILDIVHNRQAANWQKIAGDSHKMYALAYYMAQQIKETHGTELKDIDIKDLAFFIGGGAVGSNYSYGGVGRVRAEQEMKGWIATNGQSCALKGICEEMLYARGMIDGGLAWMSQKTYGNDYGASADGQFIAKVYHEGAPTNSDPADPLNLIMTYYASVATEGIPQSVLFRWVHSQVQVAIQQAGIEEGGALLDETEQARQFAALIGPGNYQIEDKDGLRDVRLSDFYDLESKGEEWSNRLYRAFRESCKTNTDLAFRLADRISQNQLFTLPETREIRPSSVTKYFSAVEGFTGTPIFFGEMPATMAPSAGAETVPHIEAIQNRLKENETPVESVADYKIETSLGMLTQEELGQLTSVVDLAGMYYYSAGLDGTAAGGSNGELLAKKIQTFYREKGLPLPNVAFEGKNGGRWVLKADGTTVVPLVGSGQKSYDDAKIQPGEQTIMVHSRPMGTGSDYPHPKEAMGIMLVNPNDNGLNEAMQAIMRFRGFTNDAQAGWNQHYKILVSSDLMDRVTRLEGATDIEKLISCWKENDEVVADAGVQQALIGELEHIPADVAMDHLMEEMVRSSTGENSTGNIFTSESIRKQKIRGLERVVRSLEPFLSSNQQFDPTVYLHEKKGRNFYDYFRELCYRKREKVITALGAVIGDGQATQTEKALAQQIIDDIGKKFDDLDRRIGKIAEKKPAMQIMAADNSAAAVGDKNVEVEVETEKESEKELEEETEMAGYQTIATGAVVGMHLMEMPSGENPSSFADYLRQGGGMVGDGVVGQIFGYDIGEEGEKQSVVAPALPAREVMSRAAQKINFPEGNNFATSSRYAFYAGVFPEAGNEDFLDCPILMSYDFVHSHEHVLPIFHPDHAEAQYVVLFGDGEKTKALIVSNREAESYQEAIQGGRLTGCRIYSPDGHEIATPKDRGAQFEPDPSVKSRALAYMNMMRANTGGVLEGKADYAAIVEEAGGDPAYLQRMNRLFIVQKHGDDEKRKKECLNLMTIDSTLSTGIYFSARQIEDYVKMHPDLKEPFKDFNDMGSATPKYASLATIGLKILQNDAVPDPISVGMARSLLLAVFSQGKANELDGKLKNMDDPQSVYSQVRQSLVRVRKLPPEARNMVRELVYTRQPIDDRQRLKSSELVNVETGKKAGAIDSHAAAFLSASDAVVDFANYDEATLQAVVERAFEESDDPNWKKLQADRVRKLGQNGRKNIFMAAIGSAKPVVFSNLVLDELAATSERDQRQIFDRLIEVIGQHPELLRHLNKTVLTALFENDAARMMLIDKFVNDDNFYDSITDPAILALFFPYGKCIGRFQKLKTEKQDLFQGVIDNLNVDQKLVESIEEPVIEAFFTDLFSILSIASLYGFFRRHPEKCEEITLEMMTGIESKFTVLNNNYSDNANDEIGLLGLFFQNNMSCLTDEQLIYIVSSFILDDDFSYREDEDSQRLLSGENDGTAARQLGDRIFDNLDGNRLSAINFDGEGIEKVLIFTNYKKFETGGKISLLKTLGDREGKYENILMEKCVGFTGDFEKEYDESFRDIDRSSDDGPIKANRQIRSRALILSENLGLDNGVRKDINNWQSLAREDIAAKTTWDQIPDSVVNAVKNECIYNGIINYGKAAPYIDLIKKLVKLNKLTGANWEQYAKSEGQKMSAEAINGIVQNESSSVDLRTLVYHLEQLNTDELSGLDDAVFARLYEASAPGDTEKGTAHVGEVQKVIGKVSADRMGQIREARAAMCFLACGNEEQAKQLTADALKNVADEMEREEVDERNTDRNMVKRFKPENFKAVLMKNSNNSGDAMARILMSAALFNISKNEVVYDLLNECSEPLAKKFVDNLSAGKNVFQESHVNRFNRDFGGRYKPINNEFLRSTLEEYFANLRSKNLEYVEYDGKNLNGDEELDNDVDNEGSEVFIESSKPVDFNGGRNPVDVNRNNVIINGDSVTIKDGSEDKLKNEGVNLETVGEENVNMIYEEAGNEIVEDDGMSFISTESGLSVGMYDDITIVNNENGEELFSESPAETITIQTVEENSTIETQTDNPQSEEKPIEPETPKLDPARETSADEEPIELKPPKIEPSVEISAAETQTDDPKSAEKTAVETQTEEQKPAMVSGTATQTSGTPTVDAETGASIEPSGSAKPKNNSEAPATRPVGEPKPAATKPTHGTRPADGAGSTGTAALVQPTAPIQPSSPRIMPYVRTAAVVITAVSGAILAFGGLGLVATIICSIVMALSFLIFLLGLVLADGLPQPPVDSEKKGSDGAAAPPAKGETDDGTRDTTPVGERLRRERTGRPAENSPREPSTARPLTTTPQAMNPPEEPIPSPQEEADDFLD